MKQILYLKSRAYFNFSVYSQNEKNVYRLVHDFLIGNGICFIFISSLNLEYPKASTQIVQM